MRSLVADSPISLGENGESIWAILDPVEVLGSRASVETGISSSVSVFSTCSSYLMLGLSSAYDDEIVTSPLL